MSKHTPIVFASETVTVPSAGGTAALSRSKYRPNNEIPAVSAIVTVNAGPIVSYTLDGTTASPTVGHKVTAFGSFVIDGFDSIRRFNATSVSTGTATSINVSYLR